MSLDMERAHPRGEAFLDGQENALRQLFFLSLDPSIAMDDKVSRLLQLGCDVLGLPLGIVSRVDGSDYEVEYIVGPEWAPESGTKFEVSKTYCTHTLSADDVRHFHHAGESEIANHPCYVDFGLESYIGVPLRVGAKRVGTLNFSGPDARAPFTELEIEVVELLGRWLGQEWLKVETSKALAEKTMLLNSIIEAVPDAIIASNRNREIQMVNAATERLFGFSREELVGQNTALFYPSKSDYEKHGERLLRKAMETTIDRFEMSLRKQNGSTFEGEIFMAPLRNEADTQTGVVGVVRDVSERKALEQARDELISTVSHELRTPISSVTGALKLLGIERGNLSKKMQGMLDAALRNAERLTQLVGDILDFEKLETKGGTSGKHDINLSALVARAVADIGPYAAEHGVIVADVPVDVTAITLDGDENRLLQVLSNLLSNAVKASQPGATVEAGASEDGRGFWVRDQGEGIPETLQKNLFDRFTRAPGSYAKGQSGTGLGMSIVKNIVDQFGGEIGLQTAPGQGTTFTVTFPPRDGEAG
ncbi:GAF domain-containing sensor histidine kinase [Gymnodinialimonas ceratoperidinii]|uniref:histidine kinase n=1 Tax=Gymnodinialimonas ceratoperidinii TaxID=2856823 RepID=A0A8F6TU79_9RHOB|nr:ATP-binding protein [Gymnodinialimonas ceratoperidinii]QXT39041.1 PAS domain S-box protein [Gymnodinialimonas ceratoperidinii]